MTLHTHCTDGFSGDGGSGMCEGMKGRRVKDGRRWLRCEMREADWLCARETRQITHVVVADVIFVSADCMCVCRGTHFAGERSACLPPPSRGLSSCNMRAHSFRFMFYRVVLFDLPSSSRLSLSLAAKCTFVHSNKGAGRWSRETRRSPV